MSAPPLLEQGGALRAPSALVGIRYFGCAAVKRSQRVHTPRVRASAAAFAASMFARTRARVRSRPAVDACSFRGGRAERGCILAALLVAPATQTSLFEHTRAAAPSSATPPPSERAHDARPRSQLQLPPRSTRCCPLLSHPFQRLAQSGATWCVATSHASACAVGLARTPTRACPAAAVAVSAIATSSCQSAAPPASTAGVHKCTVGARARGWTVRGGPAFRAASSGCGALVSASAGRKRQTYQSTLRTFLRSLLPSRMR